MDYEELYKKKDCFGAFAWNCLEQCMKSYDSKDSLAIAIWSAVFLEAFLKDCLQELGIDTSKKDNRGKNVDKTLNEIIYDIENALNKESKKMSEKDKNLFKDITSRAQQIRSKRNRLVHETGVENSLVDQDALSMYNELTGIVSDYYDTSVAEGIRQANTGFEIYPDKEKEYSYSAFISTITPHSVEQIAFINGFCRRLDEIGVKPVRCESNDFGQKDPMGKVKELIEETDAFITIGLERSHVYYYKDNEGSREEKENTHRRYTSSWLQLESGMAIAMGKPIYVLCQESLFGDGIFDQNWNTYNVHTLSIPLNIHDNSINSLLKVIKKDIDENRKKLSQK